MTKTLKEKLSDKLVNAYLKNKIREDRNKSKLVSV